jgi:hypothetical protein
VFASQSRKLGELDWSVKFDTFLFGDGPSFVDCLADHPKTELPPHQTLAVRTREEVRESNERHRQAALERLKKRKSKAD